MTKVPCVGDDGQVLATVVQRVVVEVMYVMPGWGWSVVVNRGQLVSEDVATHEAGPCVALVVNVEQVATLPRPAPTN